MKRIGICPGDPAGIGYEITIKALINAEIQKRFVQLDRVAVVYANVDLWQKAVMQFAPELKYQIIKTAVQASDNHDIYIIDSDVRIESFEPGKLSAECALCAYKSLMKCTDDVKTGEISGICTGPIHKGAMRLAGISDIGHTEMLAHALNANNPMTMFMTRALNIFFYSFLGMLLIFIAKP